jgi:hypothetical protein
MGLQIARCPKAAEGVNPSSFESVGVYRSGKRTDDTLTGDLTGERRPFAGAHRRGKPGGMHACSVRSISQVPRTAGRHRRNLSGGFLHAFGDARVCLY